MLKPLLRLAERRQMTGRHPPASIPARGGVIDVPDRFTSADLEAAARVDDPLLAEAAAAAVDAGQDGQVIQYLAGVPDLLSRYAGPSEHPAADAVRASRRRAQRSLTTRFARKPDDLLWRL